MILRLAVLISLGCLAVAGPITWDDSKCSQECDKGSKFQYSPQTAYVYNYESSNELQADRSSELLTKLKATVTITVHSKCEMVLLVSSPELYRGPQKDTSSSLIAELSRNPLPFSWNDGVIKNVCPNPEDSDEVNNIKKAILSNFQNSMRGFEIGAFNTETDILGSCDTMYNSKDLSDEKFTITRKKNIPSCSNHLKGQTLLLASYYQSSAHRQHLPFLSDESSVCTQSIARGIIEEVKCSEAASFKPLSDYGYVVKTAGESTLKFQTSRTFSGEESSLAYKTPKRESLVYRYQPHPDKNPGAENNAKNILSQICQNPKDLISNSHFAKLVNSIREMDTQAVERVYSSVKNGEVCQSGKIALNIYLDAVRLASSGGSMALITKLISSGDMSPIDTIIWLTMLPFTSYVEEESISSLIPLLRKDKANRQTLLGITALAYKYCSINPECQSSQAIKDLSSRLKEFLGNKCNAGSQEEETQILTALKSFGNLGYFGESANDLFECALTATNKVQLRVAAMDAFRRSPCSEETTSKLLEIYSNGVEHDEVRMTALLSLSKCINSNIVGKIVDVYNKENSRQVEVFTWSLLENIDSSSDPSKREILLLHDLKKPRSTDLTKFSRNFEISLFSQLLNLGIVREANIIHSSDSFLPRSANAAYKLNIFGNTLEPFEIGARMEDMEHILEKLFGPVGIFSNVDLESLAQLIPTHLRRNRRQAENYESKVEALSERLGYKRNKSPHATAFIRIMGHELGLIHLNDESLKRVAGIKVTDVLKQISNIRNIDATKNIFFTEVAVLFPSITGKAYKLSATGNLVLGLKGDGKIDLRQPNFPIPKVDIDGKFHPSILGQATASLTIYSKDYEPGVIAETKLAAELDYQAKIEIKDGRLFHVKLKREKQSSEILHLKRSMYYRNHNGQVEMEKPPSYNLNYCTKFLQRLTGAKYCASLRIPHAFTNGKFKIPLVREMEASIVVEQTDPSLDGYEFLLEIPEYGNKQDRRFKILLDTPNSPQDRKLSLAINMRQPDDSSCSLDVDLHTPIYSMDMKANMENKDNQFRLSAEGSGDKRRRYSMKIDANKVVKGARLVEYQPTISVSMPSGKNYDFTGTVVFSKGRKTQISINMDSASFSSPFTIKGNIAREGETIDISSNWKMNYEFNANAFSQIHRVQGAVGYQVGNGLFIDMGHHYEPDGRSYESITLNAKVENIKIFERLSFSIDSKILFAEHQDLNTMLKWDFSFKPLHHFKNDFIFRYGENFEDDTHLVRFLAVSALHGDFNSLQKLSVENKLGLTISCLNFDKSASLSAVWDIVDYPKLILDAGIKTQKDKQIKLELNYRHFKNEMNNDLLKIQTDFQFTYNTFQFKYRDEATETTPGSFSWKSTIEPSKGKEITTDFIYNIKEEGGGYRHELEGTIKFPGLQKPVKQKGFAQFTRNDFQLQSNTDLGPSGVYMLDIHSQRSGKNEVKLNTPMVEGNLIVESGEGVRAIRADVKSKGKYKRRIIVSGSMKPGSTNTLDLDVQWDADNDPDKKITIQLTSSKETEEGVEKHIIGGSVNYEGSINVDISGTFSTDLIRGPHFFRAEFSGTADPMAIEIEHEIKGGELNAITRYLRTGVEKIRLDIKGKFIYRPFSHLELGGGLYTSSPYKTFDGKVLNFLIYGDSNSNTRIFKTEYKVKFSPVIGYEGKLDYERKRGWPGNVRSNLLVTLHNRPMYEGSAQVDYGNGKYSFKTNFTPLTNKKFNFITSFEHSSRFVAFHHSLATSLQLLQTVDLNAVADLRNIEDAKIHSNMDVNAHKLYDVNGTMKIKSIFDFDVEAKLFSKITPSLKIFSKSQNSGQVSKFDFNLDVNSRDIITGSGEIKKKKRGFSGDAVFKYKEREILVLTLLQDGKGKHERSYVIKLKFPSRLYTANIKVNREKKGSVNYVMKLCRNEELCIDIDATHTELEGGYKWDVAYKRGDVEFNIERIRESKSEYERFHTVLYKGDHRFGYDARFGVEGQGRSLSLGIILPSREIILKGTLEFSISKPRIKLEFSSDGKNHPDRKLITDIRFENHLRDNNPSKFDITVSHPIFEKPIDIVLLGDYEGSQPTYFTAEGSVDYSSNPDDKLIGKLSMTERSGTDEMLLNIYHKDQQHLDFVIKAQMTDNSDEMSFGMDYNWKNENNADEKAYMIAKYLEKEKRFSFEYKRPKLTYSLEGKITNPNTLLNDTCEVDLTSIYNGETTKGKFIANDETGCYKLIILNGEEVSRVVELCLNLKTRKMFSLLTESVDDEGVWAFDYLFEIVRKDWRTMGIRHQINPEFLGGSLFKLTAFLDELDEARVGSLPFYDSPRFKIIRQSFGSKVYNPAKQFVVPEATKFVKDLINDMKYLRTEINQYYSKLPSLQSVREKIYEARLFVRSIAKEIWFTIKYYYEGYTLKTLEFIDKVRSSLQERCRNIEDCGSLMRAYQNGGWKGVLTQVRELILALPGRIENYIQNPGDGVKNAVKNLMNTLRPYLEPLKDCRCGEIVVKVAKLSYEALEPPFQAFMSRAPSYYNTMKQRLTSNEYVQAVYQVVKEGYLQIRREIVSIDYKRLATIIRMQIEDYLSTISPPTKQSFVTVNAFNIEKGVIDLDVHSFVETKLMDRISSALWIITDKSVNIGLNYNWNTLLIKFKRGLDLNFIPPYDAQGMIVGHQYFITFDKVFYDFAGECSYLLTRDFEDGNFTVILKPKVGDQPPSVLVIRGDKTVEFSSGKSTVKVAESGVELPYLSKQLRASRLGNTIVVDTKNGLLVKCNLVREICTFDVSGWYFGKTAGLLGTYNYEDYDEFKRPKGHIANSVAVHAKSWELKKGCKAGNLVPDVQIVKDSNDYRKCESYFKKRSSPLAACFSEVPNENYFLLCTRHVAYQQSDKKSALCNVAAAYVTECEKNYVELNLPSDCLTCDAPDGSKLDHGDRKKFENLRKKSADTVFIIEDNECNKVIINDLGKLGSSIEKELQNEGFKDIMFGIIGYGGEIGDPQIFTAKDKIFFGSRDIGSIAERFKLESQKVDASRAFEAMKHAVTHIFRSDTAKSIVLISCSPCKYDYTSLQYPVIQQILLERGISLHVIRNTEIPVRKSSSKEKNIIGVDPDTVYHTKDVTQKDLTGEPALRSQVVMPKDLCIALSQDVDGSYFSTYPVSKGPSNEVKNWRGVFSRKFLKSTQVFTCQWCDCTSTRDHSPNTVCQPCETKRPRLPFSVGSTNIERTVDAFLSYLLQVMRD